MALIGPVVACLREQTENGRTYLHELVFGDLAEPCRRAGLALVTRLEDGITGLLARGDYMAAADAATLARVVTAITSISRCRAFLHLQMNMLKGQ